MARVSCCVLLGLALVTTTAVAAAAPPTASATSTTVTATPASSSNEPPADSSGPAPSATTYSVGALLGANSNGYGIGLGVRGGATLASRIYVGGIFMYYASSSASSGSNAIQLGGEVGYGILAPPVIVRPFAGLGVLASSDRNQDANAKDTSGRTGLALSLGCTVAYRIPASAFAVGGELRVIAPLGVLLPRGLGLRIESATEKDAQGKPTVKDIGSTGFVKCVPSGCVAEVEIDEKLDKELKNGQTASFIIFDKPNEGRGLPLTLVGYEKGMLSLK